MGLRRHPDGKLRRLREITDARGSELVELGRIAEVIDAPAGVDAFVEWTGASHAVAVLAGACVQCGAGVRRRAVGDVFLTRPGDRLVSDGGTLAVAPADAVDVLRRLTRPRATASRERRLELVQRNRSSTGMSSA